MHELPTIVSFYTYNWKYPNYAKKMQIDCDRLGLKHHIVSLPDTGKWIDNTKRKPQFILDTLNELKRPVLWVDVDGTVYKRPEIFDESFDYDWAAKKKRAGRVRVWHVGTMYFSYNDRVLAFLEEWIKEADKLKNSSDELALDILWKNQSDVVQAAKAGDLPDEYFQMLNPSQPDALRHTVIGHRASEGDSKKKFMDNQPKVDSNIQV